MLKTLRWKLEMSRLPVHPILIPRPIASLKESPLHQLQSQQAPSNPAFSAKTTRTPCYSSTRTTFSLRSHRVATYHKPPQACWFPRRQLLSSPNKMIRCSTKAIRPVTQSSYSPIRPQSRPISITEHRTIGGSTVNDFSASSQVLAQAQRTEKAKPPRTQGTSCRVINCRLMMKPLRSWPF